MMPQTTEQKLRDLANLITSDADYAQKFQTLSLEGKAQELLNQGFTQEDIGYLLTDPEMAKDISLAARKIWAP